MKENRKLLKEVLKDIQHDMTDEEVLNLLADSKISESPTAEKYTLGQRAADAIAKFAGSWAFIFSFTGVLLLWMVVNTILWRLYGEYNRWLYRERICREKGRNVCF